MRVIAGNARRLLLKAPLGDNTRPTTDRIKQTLFNMIQNEVPGSVFLDLFAGSGAIGIEALSRGADYAVFVENDKNALTCIEENLKHTGMYLSACSHWNINMNLILFSWIRHMIKSLSDAFWNI